MFTGVAADWEGTLARWANPHLWASVSEQSNGQVAISQYIFNAYAGELCPK